MSNQEDALQKAKELLRKAKSVFVITGAGVSAESGVPTFREAAGMWKQIDPMKVATPEAFYADPAFVWEWYDQRRTHLKDVKPNPGHYALASLEKTVDRYFLLTQNVDDLHEQAGSLNLAHIHGKIWEVRCAYEGTIREDRRAPLPEIPPRCQVCGELERPNVVWFGEAIEANAVGATQSFLSEGPVDVVMIIGTEASFGYITHWAQHARDSQGTLIEINPGETSLTPFVDIHLKGKSGEILPQIVPAE